MKAALLTFVLAASAAVPRLAPDVKARLEAARAGLKQQLAAKPDDALLWKQLGEVHQTLGEAELARDAFLQATLLDPADAGAWSLLAVAHEKLKELPQAIAAWEACLARSKEPQLSAVARKHLLHLKP